MIPASRILRPDANRYVEDCASFITGAENLHKYRDASCKRLKNMRCFCNTS